MNMFVKFVDSVEPRRWASLGSRFHKRISCSVFGMPKSCVG